MFSNTFLTYAKLYSATKITKSHVLKNQRQAGGEIV